jgi:anti-sigma B factor antagonist
LKEVPEREFRKGEQYLKLTTARKAQSAVVTISGRIDVYTASMVGETIQSLIADGALNIVIDLSAVPRLDSSGLGTLVGNAKSMALCGGVICLVGANQGIKKALRLTNLARYFRIHDEMEQAMEELESCTLGQTVS